MSKHSELLARLLPPVAYEPSGPSLSSDLAAEGSALDRFLAEADGMLAGVVPSFAAIQLLPDWERLFDIAPSADATLQQRMAKVDAKMNETGGLSIPYFVNLAQSLGYTIEIQEPQPFRVNENGVGDAIYVEDVIYQWLVVVEGAPNLAYFFRVGESAVGEPLLDFSNPMLEEVIQDLKPAHTYVYFAYQG